MAVGTKMKLKTVKEIPEIVHNTGESGKIIKFIYRFEHRKASIVEILDWQDEYDTAYDLVYSVRSTLLRTGTSGIRVRQRGNRVFLVKVDDLPKEGLSLTAEADEFIMNMQ